MRPKLVLYAVSATLAVTVFYLFNWKVVLISAVYVIFLFAVKDRKLLLFQLAAAALFGIIFLIQEHHNETLLNKNDSSFRLVFSEVPMFDGNSLRALVKTDQGEKLVLSKKIRTREEKTALEENFQPGMVCVVSGSLEQPDLARNENAFNYRTYLSHKRIHWILRASKIEGCSINQESLFTKVKQLRFNGLKLITKHFPKESEGIAAALLFGETGWINEQIMRNYQTLGIVHLLSISGLHVTVLAGGLFFVGIRIGITRKKMQVLLIFILPLYSVLTGMTPPVIRSCSMVMLYLALKTFNKKITGAETICIMYLVLTAWDPYIIFDVGFQLSFSVTGGLLFSSKIITRYQNIWLQSLMISGICQLCSLPLMLYHFFEISAAGVFLNIIFVPLYSFLLLPLSILSFMALLFSPLLANPLINLFHIFILLSNDLTDILSRIPFSSIVFGMPAFIILFLLSGLVLYLFYSWEKSGLRACRKLLIFMSILLCYQYFSEYLTPFGEVTFLDVGQGDSIFIRLPFGRGTYLIDTGGQVSFTMEEWEKKSSSFETGEDIVVPFLKGKGITNIDKLILTHPDIDHIGGAANVLKEVRADQIVLSKMALKGYQQKGILNQVKRNSVIPVKAGDNWTTGKENFYILNPVIQTADTNEASIVLYALIANKKWLFTGDLGKEGEAGIMDKFPSLRVDILKAGHHGSKNSTSESFISRMSPKLAVISAGRRNRYGHPNQEALSVLTKHAVQIYRTDQNGAITFRFCNDKGTFSRLLP